MTPDSFKYNNTHHTPNHMSEFEDIQKLIRLKRHELPPQGFVDEFVAALKERQRSELLQGSARGLLWERVTTYFADLFNPKWALAGAAAVAITMGVLMMNHRTTPQLVQNTPAATSAVEIVSFSGRDDSSDVKNNLISHHYGGGFADEQNTQPANFAQPFQGGVQTAGFKGDLEIPSVQQH